jgi:hypothetical protein
MQRTTFLLRQKIQERILERTYIFLAVISSKRNKNAGNIISTASWLWDSEYLD